MKNMLAIAYQLAAESFIDKVDKQGRPYFEHCLQVMQNLNTDDDELKQIALLHDYLEDIHTENIIGGTKILREIGFSDRVITGIIAMTRLQHEEYEEYIDAIKGYKDAVRVKIADLKHNSDITRLKGLREKDIERMIKYHTTYIDLTEYIKEMEDD